MKNIKLIKKCFFVVFAFMLQIQYFTAQNLVPNPSFEEYSACPDNYMQIERATNWSSFLNSPDYFNTCTSFSDMSIPNNGYGYQYPPSIECNAYIGLVSWGGLNYREYTGSELLHPLEIGQKYYVSFKICLSEISVCATNKLGILFSTIEYNISNPAPIFNFAHVYTSDIIADTLNWTTISGSFTADSSYKYIIIGNFFDDLHTDRIIFSSGNNAAYFFDDICVSIDSAYCSNYIETCGTINIPISDFKNQIIIYPNPAKNQINIEILELNSIGKNYFELYDVYGRLVIEKHLPSRNNKVNVEHLKPGVYLIKIYNNDKSTVKKILIK